MPTGDGGITAYRNLTYAKYDIFMIGVFRTERYTDGSIDPRGTKITGYAND